MKSYKITVNDLALELTSLGDTIYREWKKCDFRQPLFPKIASEVLKESKLHTIYSPSDVINLALGAPPITAANQVNSPFGDLQLTVYNCDRFYIEVLYWIDGLTSIHDHGFCGAFMVLSGESINVEYDFQLEEMIHSQFNLGTLKAKLVKKLNSGDVTQIYPGREFIHSVFHLKNPTVSIVVRTFNDNITIPQLEYRGNHLALVDNVSPGFLKKIQALKHMKNGDLSTFKVSFMEIYSGSSLDEKYWLLRAFYSVIPEVDDLLVMIERGSDKELPIILNVLNDEAGQSALIKLRDRIHDEDLRYFIALLLNLSNWRDITDYISRYVSTTKVDYISDKMDRLNAIDKQFPSFKDINLVFQSTIKNGSEVRLCKMSESIRYYIYRKYIRSTVLPSDNA